MPRGTAGHQQDAIGLNQGWRRSAEVEHRVTCLWNHSSAEGIEDGAGLLEDLLQHEMLVAPLFGHDGIPGHMADIFSDRLPIEGRDAYPFARQRGHLAIVQEDDLTGVV